MDELWHQLVQGADVIVGAFIGGGAAFTAYLADRRRFGREDRYRDHSERRRVYSEFLAKWDAYERARNTLYIGPDRTEVEDARWQFHSSFNALSLLAPEEVRAAADALLKWSEQDPPDRDPAVPGLFWKAARKDLDIPLPERARPPSIEERS
jgi:hypothetical protein